MLFLLVPKVVQQKQKGSHISDVTRTLRCLWPEETQRPTANKNQQETKLSCSHEVERLLTARTSYSKKTRHAMINHYLSTK